MIKIGDRVKIEMCSQAAIEVFCNDEKREKWENTNRIGFVTDITKAPAGNKLVRVGTHPEDRNGDYFFPGDLRDLKPGEGMVYLVIEHGLHYPEYKRKVVAVCTDSEIAEEIKARDEHKTVIQVPVNEKIKHQN